jgi:sugar lactone lactonase YvrE
MAEIFDDRACALGEGPLWHPLRDTLYWFDITANRLLCRGAAGPQEWPLGENASAAGWIDRDRLLLASETALWVFDIDSGALDRITGLEADNPVTRSNDGRADPWGGFWIGTMGKAAEPDAGAIWRLWRGELRRLYAPITISNAISFTPDRRHAHFADTAKSIVWRVALDPATGWPKGEPSVFLDLGPEGLRPDGAVCDAAGNLWLAEWGAARVSVYGPDGRRLGSHAVGGRHSSCPAFGGPGFGTLFVTTARQGLSPAVLAAEPQNGCTFALEPGATGLAEYQVLL